jgi:outer membrane receptor for ferrienterochelin and colicins
MHTFARHLVSRIGLACLLLAGVPHWASAQNATALPLDLATMTLDELMRVRVTTASKKAESMLDAPAIMVVLTDSDVQAYGSRSLVEVLDRTTSIFFMGNQENIQGALTMRGDVTLGANNHVLVLVNGRPIQESTYGGMIHPFLRAFPLASVQQIEVVRGPGSVLYGTNAYVGVINVITKNWDSGGIADVSYGTFDTRTASVAGGKNFGNLQMSAGVTVSHDDGWNFTATDSIDGDKPALTQTARWFDRKVGLNFNSKYMGLNVDAFYVTTQTPHLTNSTATTSWTRYGISDASQAMVDVGYRHIVSPRWTSSIHGTYNRFTDLADFGEIGVRDIHSNSYLVDWTNELTVTPRLNAVFGANLSKRTGSFYEATFDWYGVPSYSRNSLTGFAQADYRPASRLKLIAGAQVIKIPGFTTHVTGGQSAEESRVPGLAPHVVGRLGAIVSLPHGFGIKLLHSEAFRQPSVVETDLVRYDEGEYSQEGNPDLQPEEIATSDLQINYGSGHVNAAVTMFVSRQSNVIAETADAALIQNFDRSQTRGVEGEARVRFAKHFELTSAVTYQKLDNTTNPIFQFVAIPVAPFMAKVGLSYRSESGLTLGVHDSYFGSPRESSYFDEDDAADTTKYVNPTATAFHDVRLSASYRLGRPGFLGRRADVTTHVSVSNLLDEAIHYPEYTSVNVNSIPGRPGRAAFAGVTVGW